MKEKIESILFVSIKPLSLNTVSKLFKCSKQDASAAFDELIHEYNTEKKGIHITKLEQRNDIKYQMITNPELYEFIKDYYKQEINRELTRPALETLTIISYRGPITKPELEKIRGVNCSLILRNLLIRDLIHEETDKKTGDTYFSITLEFMKWLGISDQKELPDYERLNTDENLIKVVKEETN